MLNSFFDKFIFTNSLKYSHNNFFLVNLPFVILPVEALVAIAERNDASLNHELYSSVKEAVMGSIKKQFRLDFGVQGDEGLEFMQTFFSASGWGDIQRTDLDFGKSRALVSVKNSPVAMNAKKARFPADTFLRGFLAGIFSIYFRKDVECVETRCFALNSQQCDFVIKPLADLNFDNKFTRRQLKVE